MTKYLLVSQNGELLPVAQRLQEEGADVELVTTGAKGRNVGRGLIPLAKPMNLLQDDIKRGYLILNHSSEGEYSKFSDLGWRVLGNKPKFFPRNSFLMTKMLGIHKQVIPPTQFVSNLNDVSMNGVPYRISKGGIGADVTIEGEKGAAWLQWQARKNKGPFMVQEIPEGAELELGFWVLNGELLSPLLAAVVQDGQALSWSEKGDACKELLLPVMGELSGYTGPIWTTIRVTKQPRKALLRTLSGQWPSYMWGSFLALLQGELSSFLEDVFNVGELDLDHRWAWIMPVTSAHDKLPFISMADILGNCPIKGEAQLWDAHKEEDTIITGGVSEMPITLWGKGDSPGAAQEDAEERWIKLECPFKTKAPSVMDQFIETLDTLKAYNLCTKEA